MLREQVLEGEGVPSIDFLHPKGESALVGADSVSWRIFRNPVALYIGGVTAVLLELAEPQVRSGVWEHTQFRSDPLRRMRRTGLAAMVTVYAARSVAEDMIEGVGKMHGRVSGRTPAGQPYRADDPELLRWVHATALFGFMEAYHQYVKPLSQKERDTFIAEGAPVARLYGAADPPTSESEMREIFQWMKPRLEKSEIIGEFLQIMGNLSIFLRPLRFVNRWLLTAAVGLLPEPIIDRLGLQQKSRLSRPIRFVLRWAGAVVNRLDLKSAPATQACIRLGLPAEYLVDKS